MGARQPGTIEGFFAARPADLDAKVRVWLGEAYEFGKIDRRRRGPKA